MTDTLLELKCTVLCNSAMIFILSIVRIQIVKEYKQSISYNLVFFNHPSFKRSKRIHFKIAKLSAVLQNVYFIFPSQFINTLFNVLYL